MKRLFEVHGEWLSCLISCFVLSLLLGCCVDYAPELLEDSAWLQYAFDLGVSGKQLPGFFYVVGCISGFAIQFVFAAGDVFLKWCAGLKRKKST